MYRVREIITYSTMKSEISAMLPILGIYQSVWFGGSHLTILMKRWKSGVVCNHIVYKSVSFSTTCIFSLYRKVKREPNCGKSMSENESIKMKKNKVLA